MPVGRNTLWKLGQTFESRPLLSFGTSTVQRELSGLHLSKILHRFVQIPDLLANTLTINGMWKIYEF